MSLRFDPVPEADILICRVDEEKIIDEATIVTLRSELFQRIEHDACRNFLFDMKSVTFMSSTFLSVLIGAQKRVAKRRGKIAYFGLHPDIRAVTIATLLEKANIVIALDGDEASAIEAFQGVSTAGSLT